MTSATFTKLSDGESLVHIEDNVRSKDVFIMEPTSHSDIDYLMELLFTTDTL